MERELEDAFVAAVRLNRHRLYRVALSILRSPADAEDAVSTATEQTWKSLPRIQDTDRLPVYLMRCTVNAARTELRKRRKTEPLEDYRDTLAAPELDEELARSLDGVKDLTLDMSAVEYISSAGLRVLLSAQKRMNRQGSMTVTNVGENIMEIFDVTGFSDILNIQ